MQISTSLFYDRSTAAMAALTQHADQLQNQITSTKRISAPSDDVTAYQRLQTLAQAGANDGVYSANISLAQSLNQQSDSALTDITAQLQHAQELAIQAKSGTLSDDDREVIATQLKAIVDNLATIANSKDVRGGPLFGAASGDSGVTQAADGTVSFTATGDPAAIPIGDGQSILATDSAQRVFGGIPATGGGTTDVFAVISELAAALDAGGDVSTAAGSALDDLQSSLDHVSGVQASVGARGARLDLEADRLTDTAATREASRSSLEDTDVTAAITELQKTMTILSATQASFTKLSQLSLFDYLS